MTKRRREPTEKERRDLFEESQRDTLEELKEKRNKPRLKQDPEDDEPRQIHGPRLKR